MKELTFNELEMVAGAGRWGIHLGPIGFIGFEWEWFGCKKLKNDNEVVIHNYLGDYYERADF